MPRVKLNLEGDNKTKLKEYTRNIGRYNRKQMTQLESLDFEILGFNVQEILHEKLNEALGYNIKDLINRKYKRHEPIIKVVMNMKYLGQSLIFYKNPYSRSAFMHRQKYTFDWIEKFSNNISTYLHQNNVRGNISTALLYPHGWRAGKMSDIGQNVVLHNPNQVYQYVNEVEIPEEFQKFNIFLFLKSNAPEGGASNFNDCFYDCLKYYVYNIEELIGKPADLKSKLKIKRIDKIKIEHIDAIEKLLKNKYKINITGDYIRTSSVNSTKEINIILQKEHYEPILLKRKYIPYERFKEKKLILIDKIDNFTCYDGEKVFIMDKNEYDKNVYDPNYYFESEYIIIPRDKRGFKDDNGNKLDLTLEEEYDLTKK